MYGVESVGGVEAALRVDGVVSLVWDNGDKQVQGVRITRYQVVFILITEGAPRSGSRGYHMAPMPIPTNVLSGVTLIGTNRTRIHSDCS